MHKDRRKPRLRRLFPVLAGLVAERLDRLDFERFQVYEEHAPAAAACVSAGARGGAAKLNDVGKPAPGARRGGVEDSHVM